MCVLRPHCRKHIYPEPGVRIVSGRLKSGKHDIRKLTAAAIVPGFQRLLVCVVESVEIREVAVRRNWAGFAGVGRFRGCRSVSRMGI